MNYIKKSLIYALLLHHLYTTSEDHENISTQQEDISQLQAKIDSGQEKREAEHDIEISNFNLHKQENIPLPSNALSDTTREKLTELYPDLDTTGDTLDITQKQLQQAHISIKKDDAQKASEELESALFKDNQSTFKDTSQTKPIDIKEKLENLPPKNRPQNIQKALEDIKQGKSIWESIENGDFKNKIIDRIQPQPDKAIINDLQSGNYSAIPETFLNQYKDEYQKAIVELQWYFYGESIKQEGSAFGQGMITIPDKNNQIFNFLDTYAELLTPHYKEKLKFVADKGSVYKRISSHFNGERTNNDSNYGIDIYDENDNFANILPNNRHHILFGQRDNGTIFIKWEDHGLTPTDVVTHISGYARSKAQKYGLYKLFKIDRKEHIPNDIMKKFIEISGIKKPSLINRIFNTQEAKDYKATIKDIKTRGITKMIEYLKNDKSKEEEFTRYLTETKSYNKDTLHLRKGNEVVLPGIQQNQTQS